MKLFTSGILWSSILSAADILKIIWSGSHQSYFGNVILVAFFIAIAFTLDLVKCLSVFFLSERKVENCGLVFWV
jgi:hypothetical protein